MRITNDHLENAISILNKEIARRGYVGRYGVEFCYGHTNVVFYSDPNSTGCSDVVCGLTKSEAYDILRGINHCLFTALH